MERIERIGNICEVLNGYAFKSDEYVAKGIRVMRITNVQKGKVVDDEPKYFPIERNDEISKYLLREGDLLMSLTGNVGRVGILPSEMLPAALNQRVACLRKKTEDLSMKYLFYILNSDIFESDCIFNASGIAQKNMSTRWLEEYTIPLPSLQEQERIVAELDLLTGIIDKQKQQLKELDTLAQSIFYDMFGYPEYNEKGRGVKTMGEIGSLQRGSGLSKKDLVEEGFPCILYGQIHTKFGAYAERNIAFIPEDLVHTAKIAHSGDLVMALTSEDVEGSCKSVAWLGNYDVAVGSDAAIFSHSENGIYLSYYTQTRAFYNEKAKYARGFKVTHISTKDIATIPVMIPPRLLQDEFALKVQFIEKQKESINRSIAESQKLFDYTMDKYFG